MEHTVLTGIIGLLAASVALLALFERVGLPILLAYLLLGIVLGPSGLSWIPHTRDLHFLAEFGVVLLLFTIGLEFPLGRLWTFRWWSLLRSVRCWPGEWGSFPARPSWWRGAGPVLDDGGVAPAQSQE